MKQLKFLLTVLLTMVCVSGWAQNSKLYTEYTEGVEVKECTEVCLYNIGAHRFLTDGMDWGTHATVDNAGRIINLQPNGINFAIYTRSYSNTDKAGYMTSNGYLDTPNPDYWTFESTEVGGYTNVYKIKLSDTQYLTYNSADQRVNVTDPTNSDTDCWIIIPLSERISRGDYTFLIQNSEFNRPWERKIWLDEPGTGGLGSNYCAEFWNRTFHMSQTFNNVPNGIYRLKVQGFYRVGKNDYTSGNNAAAAAAARDKGEEVINAFFYANDVEVPFHSIFDNDCHEDRGGDYVSGSQVYTIGGETCYIPTDMSRASAWLSEGYYETSVEVEVTNGVLTIGAKNEVDNPEQWAIFDNFRLEYLGESDGQILDGFLYTEIGGEKKFLSRGYSWCTRAILGDFGVPVSINIAPEVGKTRVKFLDSQLYLFSNEETNLYTDITYSDERTPFIISGNETDGYVLKADNTTSTGYVGVYDGWKLKHVANEQDALVWHFMSQADYDALIASRNLAYRSAGYTVEELNKFPVEIVKDASATETTERGEVWNIRPYKSWNFTELEKGLYKVNVKAFFRASSIDKLRLQAAAGYDAHLAFLRANGDSVQVSSILSSKLTDNSLGESAVTYNNVTYYVPQWLDQADNYFNAGYYDNVLYTNVGDDGKLDIALVCDGFVPEEWIVYRDLVISRVGNVPATMSVNAAAKYGTFYAPFDVKVPEGVEASTCEAMNGNTLVLESVDRVIPAYTPVVLHSELEGGYKNTFYGIEATEPENAGNSLLVGVLEAIQAPIGSYVLQNKSGDVKFYLVNEESSEGKTVTIQPNRCYLNIPGGSEVKAFGFVSEEVDAINSINADKKQNNGVIYNLNGQRLNSLQKGLNIVNGQKVYIK